MQLMQVLRFISNTTRTEIYVYHTPQHNNKNIFILRQRGIYLYIYTRICRYMYMYYIPIMQICRIINIPNGQ